MWSKRKAAGRPLPDEFMEWQIELRKHTALERGGSPHVGVAPLLTVRAPGVKAGFLSHSIICGLLPEPEQLEAKTVEFRELYEGQIDAGARAVYDTGLAYLEKYYERVEDFDPISITTLLPDDLPVVKALRASSSCALVFYVFDLTERSRIGRMRCTHIDCEAEILTDGPVYDNVWWHNTLFHGPAEDSVVIHFRHRASWNTAFGQLESLRASA